MLIRAKSAGIRPSVKDISILQQELNHQKKKSTLLDGDRKEFWKQAENVKQKNKETIEKLKQENKRLKELRDELMGNKKNVMGLRTASATSLSGVDIKDENYWRLALDRQRHDSKSKMKNLLQLQSMLKKVEDTKAGCLEESPVVKNIRVLENRLDKVMIKYNEAQSIKKTYQQIVKRLKEERVGYDNQLAAIERNLKSKQHDFEELLLLAHDATHAKELAQMELKKYEHKKNSIQELRSKYLEEKRSALETRKSYDDVNPVFEQKQHRQEERENPLLQDVIHYKEQSNYQKQELTDYEDAFRKLKEVTGVLDSNQIIQKFKTQSLTKASFADLSKSYESKVEKLKKQRLQIKQELDRLKLYGNGDSAEANRQNKQRLDDLEDQTAHARTVLAKSKLKYQRISKVLDSVKAGTEHLARFLDFCKLPEHLLSPAEGYNEPGLLLRQINEKLNKVFQIVKNDPDYHPDLFRQNAYKIEEYFQAREPSQTPSGIAHKNNRITMANSPQSYLQRDDDEISDLEIDDDGIAMNYEGLAKTTTNNNNSLLNNNINNTSVNSSNLSITKNTRPLGSATNKNSNNNKFFENVKRGYSASAKRAFIR